MLANSATKRSLAEAAGSWRNTLAAMPLVLDELARLGLPAVTPAPAMDQPAGSL